jgi:hypothetical protein
MSFTVIWLNRATGQLTDLWMTAPDRAGVTAASNRIDRQLAVDPYQVGESRGGSLRIGIEAPIQILFRVYFRERRVEVYRVA